MRLARLSETDYGVYWDSGLRFYRYRERDETGEWFTFYRPRFWRQDDGWWLAPLIRIGIGNPTSASEEFVIEIPWIESEAGRIKIKLYERS